MSHAEALERCRREQLEAAAALALDPESAALRLWLADQVGEEVFLLLESASAA